jgi:hypothetical protein
MVGPLVDLKADLSGGQMVGHWAEGKADQSDPWWADLKVE